MFGFETSERAVLETFKNPAVGIGRISSNAGSQSGCTAVPPDKSQWLGPMDLAPLPNDAPAMRDLDALLEVHGGGELTGRHRRRRLPGPRRPQRVIVVRRELYSDGYSSVGSLAAPTHITNPCVCGV